MPSISTAMVSPSMTAVTTPICLWVLVGRHSPLWIAWRVLVGVGAGVEVAVGAGVSVGGAVFVGVMVGVGVGGSVGVLVGLACWVWAMPAEMVASISIGLTGLEPEQAPSSKRMVSRMTILFIPSSRETHCTDF